MSLIVSFAPTLSYLNIKQKVGNYLKKILSKRWKSIKTNLLQKYILSVEFTLKWVYIILQISSREVKEIRPDIHVKAFTAVELEYMCRKAKVSFEEGLSILKSHGQDSLPGGGAEIFDEQIRAEICNDKCSSKQWLEIHETAHKLGMPSNATMLYGHIEEPKHLIDHMNRLRNLQDKTQGFNTFIPLKFRNGDNQMSHIPEVSVIEDLKVYAISRIFMDNFPH